MSGGNAVHAGGVSLAWNPGDRVLMAERVHYQGDRCASIDGVLSERLRVISSALSDRSIDGTAAMGALLPVLAAYGVELHQGPITVRVDAETIPEEEGLVPT